MNKYKIKHKTTVLLGCRVGVGKILYRLYQKILYRLYREILYRLYRINF